MLYINHDQDHCKLWKRCNNKFCENQYPQVYMCIGVLVRVETVSCWGGVRLAEAMADNPQMSEIPGKPFSPYPNLKIRPWKTSLEGGGQRPSWDKINSKQITSLQTCWAGTYSARSWGVAWGHDKTKVMWYQETERPGWCGLGGWVLACEPKGRWFDSQSGHKPGL